MQKKLLFAVGIVASSLILTSTTFAAQSTTNNQNNGNGFGLHKQNGRGTLGTISSISGNTITITTRERGSENETTKIVTVTSDTKFTQDRDTVIALSNLASGQKVMIHGTADTSGNITATMVNVETKTPEFKGPNNNQ